MKAIGSLAIGMFFLVSLGCATAPGSESLAAARVAGVWRGDAPIGASIGCCVGASGPVRLVLEQKGDSLTGSVDGLGFRGTVTARPTADGLRGSCDCQMPNSRMDLRIEGSVAGDEMIFRIGDARMTLTR